MERVVVVARENHLIFQELMTGPEMVTMFNGFVDDKLNDDLIYQLFNNAKFEIEQEREWEALKDLDETQSIEAGHTYTTEKDLPTRFLTSMNVFVGDSRTPYEQIQFELRERYRDASNRWYLKLIDNKFFICGVPVVGSTIFFFFVKSAADITDSVPWSFPTIGHPLIPIKAAKLFYPIDRIEKGRSYDDQWKVQEDLSRRGLHLWDARLKKKTKNRYPFNPSTHPRIVTGMY